MAKRVAMKGLALSWQVELHYLAEPGRTKHGFLSAVGQSVRLLASRSGVRASQEAYVALPVMNQQGQGPRTFRESKVPNVEGGKRQEALMAGLESAISSLGGRRLIHWATRALS